MSTLEGDELGAVIADFLGEAADGRVHGAAGRPFTRDQLRELRGALVHVTSELGGRDVAAIRGRDVQALVDGLGDAGLPPARVDAVVEALRSVYAYAISRRIVRSSPLVGLARDAGEPPSPTDAMIQLGERVATFMVRFVVVAFLVVAIGLVVALA